MQIKTVLRYYFSPVRLATTHMFGSIFCWQACDETGTSYSMGGNAELLYPYQKK